MIPDTFDGEQGYWNNGAWIPGSACVSKMGEVCTGVTGVIRSDIIDIHTPPIHYNRGRSISDMSEDMERVFETQKLIRNAERRAADMQEFKLIAFLLTIAFGILLYYVVVGVI